jgi:hypothetical protein
MLRKISVYERKMASRFRLIRKSAYLTPTIVHELN